MTYVRLRCFERSEEPRRVGRAIGRAPGAGRSLAVLGMTKSVENGDHQRGSKEDL